MRIGRRDVKLTNQDKVYFPEIGVTKGDLVSYYVDLAPCVLNHVERRPMQMKRYPHGVEGEFFYQKRVPVPHPDWLETVHIVFPGSGRTADFPVVTDAAGLAWIVEPRLHRAAHLALARGRRRAARLPADRPRSDRGQPVEARARRSRSSSTR